MTRDHDTLVKALGQMASRINWLADMTGLDADLRHLLTSASQAVSDGVESMLSGPDPHALDESRFLMEAEFLLRLFAREPAELEAWKRAEGYRRNQVYGFGRLMDREGRAQNVPDGYVLPERDEYAVHSQAVHPRPMGAELAPAGDPLSGLFNDLGDLLQHAVRVWHSALDAVHEVAASLEDSPAPPLPAAPDTDRAAKLLHRWNDLIVPEGERTAREAYIPRKRTHPTGGTMAARLAAETSNSRDESE